MSLGEKQELFCQLIALQITYAYSPGYKIRCGDFFALPREPLEHKKDSLHYLKCAADLNLFKDGKWLKTTPDHAELGKHWETLNPACRWGGHYGDGNHYELI